MFRPPCQRSQRLQRLRQHLSRAMCRAEVEPQAHKAVASLLGDTGRREETHLDFKATVDLRNNKDRLKLRQGRRS